MKLAMKSLLSILILLIFSAPLLADELPPYVNADWGASPDNVMFWEKEPLFQEKSELKPWQTQHVAYERTVFGRPFVLNYSFDGDALCAADYFLSENTARQLSVAEAKAIIAQIDTGILPRLGTPRTATIEKDSAKGTSTAGIWRYGKLASNERTCILIYAVVDEIGQTTQFSVSFAAADHSSALVLKEAFDHLRDDDAWVATSSK